MGELVESAIRRGFNLSYTHY
ncbi:protein of unknown function [Brevefilum fermentans]|uniref:Uncharacterized protein n=1 Tax=Candidatus Brevifilum fermentans TaxID=1986204 RepID=A0A1Y6K8S5_9CHLR|nr:protein of unknown function [Brevefilum fermentans]